MSKDIYTILESLEKVNPTPKAEEVYVPVKSKLEETIEQISEDNRLTDAVTERIVKNIERNFPELMLRHGEEQVRSIAHEEAAALTDNWPEDEGFGSSDAYGPYRATVERLGGSLDESNNYDHDSFDDEDMEYAMQQDSAAEKERKEKPKFDIERDYDFDEAAQKFTQGGKTYVTGGDEGDEVVKAFDDPATAQKFMDVNRNELNKNDPDPKKIATVDNLEKDDNDNNMHKTNEGFGDYDDFGEQEMSVLDPIVPSASDANCDGEVDMVNPELADFDPDDPTQRSRLQRGTKVMLSPVLFSDADSDRCGIISNMAPSGFNFKVIRDSDGKEINVHINDILKADLFNNTVYEELDVDFQKKLDELLEDITITRTENPEDPELDTITITGTDEDAQALADMMRNAGLTHNENTPVAEPETAMEPEEPVPGEDYVDGEQELYAEMQRNIDHANTPDEVTSGVGAVLQGGGLNKPKRQFNPWHAADNAMAIDEDDYDDEPLISDELYMQIVDMLAPDYRVSSLDLGDNGTVNVQGIDDMGRTKSFVYNPESNMLESEIVDEKWGKETQTPKSKRGMFAGKTEAELKSELAKLKASGPHKKGSAAYKKQNELEFALRAKHNWGKVPESQEVDEVSAPGQEGWIKKHKKEFIDRYGKDKGLSVLYATAWKRHNNESIGESDVDEAFGFRDDDEYGEWKYEQDRDKKADKDHPFVPMNKMNDAQRAAMKPKKREESVTESDWYTKFRGIETAGKVAVTESVKVGDKIKFKKNGKGQTRTGTVSDVDTKKGYAYIHNGATAVDIQDIIKENAPQAGAPISDEVDSFLNLYKAFGERGEKR